MKYSKRVAWLEEHCRALSDPVDADLVGLSNDELRVQFEEALTKRAQIRARQAATLAEIKGQSPDAIPADAEPSDDELRAKFEELLAKRP